MNRQGNGIPPMARWSDLDEELRHWRSAGAVPTFWWRDDDARAPTHALDRLIGLAERHEVPLHLAVVPKGLHADLRGRLSLARDVHVLQHGYAHVNHEPRGARASEIGEHRPLAAQLRDLAAGWEQLAAADLPNLLPALAPPWNRIGAETQAALPSLGYRLLSAFRLRGRSRPVPDLVQIDVHVDPVRWKEGARFRGEAATLHILIDHLQARRTGAADPDEPTGLATHHLQTDEETWEFVGHLLDRLARPGVGRWLRLSSLLSGAAAR